MTGQTATSTAGAAPELAPDLERLVAAVALLYLEVEAGRRPLQQIAGFLSPAVHERLRARSLHPAGKGRGPSIRSVRAVHLSCPSAEAVEASVVVEEPDRTRALALRLELHRGAWRIVELARPETGERPRRTASLTPRGTS